MTSMVPQPDAPDLFPPAWHSHPFHAMGSEMAVWLETADPAAAAAGFARVEALFAKYEQALSRFRPDSELSLLNGRAGRWTPVSDLMWEILTVALDMAAATGGRFDPTLLKNIRAAGYTHSFDERPPGRSGRPPAAARPAAGRWVEVALDQPNRAVRLPDGAGLDLGGLAKGFTAQRAVDLLRPLGACLVDAGGDLVAGDAPGGYPGWPVAIASPWRPSGPEAPDLVQLWLAGEAIATSGVDFRSWVWAGQVIHHLIDPATGRPAATDGLTMTVLAPDAAVAEAWATAALVAGSVAGLTDLETQNLAALLVTQDDRLLLTGAMRDRLQAMATMDVA